MYAVAVGPNAGTRCEDRGTLWRVRVPAAETIMNQHYSEESVPALTESVLMYILDQLYGRVPLNIPMKKKVCPFFSFVNAGLYNMKRIFIKLQVLFHFSFLNFLNLLREGFISYIDLFGFYKHICLEK